MGRKSLWGAENAQPTQQPTENPWATTSPPNPLSVDGEGEKRGKAEEVADLIPAAPKRMDLRKREPVATFYGVPAELHQAMKKVADDLGVPVGDVARFFLEQGLRAMWSGRLTVTPVLSEGRRTLFPTGGAKLPTGWGAPPTPKQAAAARAKRRKKGPEKVSYRGIPRETMTQLGAAAERMTAPIGEMARKLFEWGLAEYLAGRLEMTTYVASERWTLFGG